MPWPQILLFWSAEILLLTWKFNCSTFERAISSTFLFLCCSDIILNWTTKKGIFSRKSICAQSIFDFSIYLLLVHCAQLHAHLPFGACFLKAAIDHRLLIDGGFQSKCIWIFLYGILLNIECFGQQMSRDSKNNSRSHFQMYIVLKKIKIKPLWSGIFRIAFGCLVNTWHLYKVSLKPKSPYVL